MMQQHESPPSPLEHEEKEQNSPVSSPPHKIARACLISSDETELVTMAAPSPLMLGLGLGLRLGRGVEASSKPAFTFMQLQELEHQALIFKYMAAGLPVPVHLVLPIWKSVAASSFGPYHYPSLMGYGSMFLDYRNSMEPEPGRCRRTDGKKWRCSRDVVPDQKYCERHMHRGRNRSRKPVEAGAAEPGTGPTSFAAAGGEGSSSSSIQLSIGTPAGGRRLLSAGVAAARSSGVSACENV